MTGKRFIIFEKEDKSISIKDTYEGVNYPMLDWGSAKDTEELLNGLVEELNKIENKFNWEILELKIENEQLRKDLIDHSAIISMLEDYQALKIEETLFNLTGAKSEEELNELYKPYWEKAERCYK